MQIIHQFGFSVFFAFSSLLEMIENTFRIWLKPDPMLEHAIFVSYKYSNLPNNRVGPFNRVGGRFLRN